MAKPCLEAGCGRPARKGPRCPEHSRERDRARGTSKERGYGFKHKILSVQERANAVGKPCCLCGQEMAAGEPLALDHTEDRTGYRGVAHLSCNAAEGAARAGRSAPPASK